MQVFGERDGTARAAGVTSLFDIHQKTFLRDIGLPGYRFDNALVGLMRRNPIQILDSLTITLGYLF